MKRIKYVLLLIFVLIAIGIGIKILNPKWKTSSVRITPFSNIKPEDSTRYKEVNQENITYEIKGMKAITTENYYASPCFSPDGKKIAFTNLSNRGLYIENIVDGIQKRVTEDDGAGFRFSWSPDSKEIVYLSRKITDGMPDNTIKLVEIETGKIIDLTAGGIGVSMPSFSKTKGIMYSNKGTLMLRRGIIEKETMKKTYGPEEVVAENVPANIIIQTPDEKKLIIEDDEGIKIMDSNGKNRKLIIKNGDTDFACDAKVSLDGSKVLYSNNVGSKGHLFVYEINNENLIDLGEGVFGQWFKNNRIIYCVSKDDGSVITGSELYITNADGTGKMKITDTKNQIEIQPSLSPDVKSIVYRDEKNGRIYLGELIVK